jgi:phage terminase large subunit-like protein
LACPDWEERILAGRSLVPDLPLFDDEAARAVRIFSRLRLPDVAGYPTLDVALPWFLPVVAALFGAYEAETQRRMIQEVFELVPKKNGKSTGSAGVMLTAMIMNRRPAAEGVLIAPTKEIADITYRQASGMIRLDSELAPKFHTTRHQRTITDWREGLEGAQLQIKAADVDVVTGGKQTYCLIDETHVFATKSNASEVFVELRGALAARPDGFLMQITTQSKKQPSGVFKAELTRARAVRDGKLDLPMLAVLYELPERLAKDGGWKDRKNWGLVNPNLGRSVDEAFLERELRTAESEGPAKLALIASQHFNVEIGIGQRFDGWAGVKYWERRADAELTLDVLLDRSDVVVVGIDGGGLDDLFGLAVLGREKPVAEDRAAAGRWLLWSHAWCHEGVLEERKSIAALLRDFEKAGELTIVDDELEDMSEIVAHIEAIKARGILAEVAVDPAGLGELVDALAAIDVTEDNKMLVGVGQGYRLMNAIKTAERRLANGTLIHGGSSLMAWCVGNVKIEPTATAIRATKQNAGDAKIDPWAAAMNAIDRMSLNPEGSGSVYDFRDLRVL